jgi:outer membrane protein OmpA-like peptidoglycan-associated protein
LTWAAAALLLTACAANKTQPRKPPRAQPAVATPRTPVDRKAKATGKSPVTAVPARNSVLASADVGYYLDVLQGRLQQSVDPAIIVSRADRSIVLDFSRRISFAADDTRLDDVDRGLLASLSKVLVEYRPTLVSIRVTAEDAEAAARALAQRRAGAIARALAGSGVSAAHIKTAVPDEPGRDGDTRVEIELEPIVGDE